MTLKNISQTKKYDIIERAAKTMTHSNHGKWTGFFLIVDWNGNYGIIVNRKYDAFYIERKKLIGRFIKRVFSTQQLNLGFIPLFDFELVYHVTMDHVLVKEKEILKKLWKYTQYTYHNSDSVANYDVSWLKQDLVLHSM